MWCFSFARSVTPGWWGAWFRGLIQRVPESLKRSTVGSSGLRASTLAASLPTGRRCSGWLGCGPAECNLEASTLNCPLTGAQGNPSGSGQVGLGRSSTRAAGAYNTCPGLLFRALSPPSPLAGWYADRRCDDAMRCNPVRCSAVPLRTRDGRCRTCRGQRSRSRGERQAA